MLAVVLCAVVAATPSTTIAAVNFQTVNLSENLGTFALEHLSEKLGQRGIRVITPTEIQAILGTERQKQLLGCGDEASTCDAELSNALGADSSMMGTLVKLGDTFELSLKIVSNRTGGRRAGFTERVQKESGLFEMLDRAAVSLEEQLRPPARQDEAVHLRRFTAIPVIVGATAFVGAGITAFLANDAHLDLVDRQRAPLADGLARATEGDRWQTLSVVAGAVALLSAGLATWFYLSGPGPAVTPTIGLVGGAPGITVGGPLP